MGYRFDERARNLRAVRVVAEEDGDDKSIGEIEEEEPTRMKRPLITEKLADQERIDAGSLLTIEEEDENEITEFSFRAIVQDFKDKLTKDLGLPAYTVGVQDKSLDADLDHYV